MSDKLSEILEGHISMAERQLKYIREGVQFGVITDPIPSNEIELIVLIDKWHDDLKRYRERNYAKKS